MSKRKTLQELTIKDNFMFAAVMMEGDICRDFLEMVLGIRIERVEASYEKSIVYHPAYRGVRLDVFARDENNTRYNVEMQMVQQHLEKRARYYSSQMDMELLRSGVPYGELPDTYIIFICDFDPFGEKKYCYTVRKCFKGDSGHEFQDGSHALFLSTAGENADELPEPVVKFLQFVKADLEGSHADFEDAFVRKLQKAVDQIKASREMGERYMIFEEMLQAERTERKAEERAEAVTELLEELGTVPEELRGRIMEEKEMSALKKMFRAAVKAESIEQFEKMLDGAAGNQ